MTTRNKRNHPGQWQPACWPPSEKINTSGTKQFIPQFEYNVCPPPVRTLQLEHQSLLATLKGCQLLFSQKVKSTFSKGGDIPMHWEFHFSRGLSVHQSWRQHETCLPTPDLQLWQLLFRDAHCSRHCGSRDQNLFNLAVSNGQQTYVQLMHLALKSLYVLRQPYQNVLQDKYHNLQGF